MDPQGLDTKSNRKDISGHQIFITKVVPKLPE